MGKQAMFNIEVVYAMPALQQLIRLQVPAGTSIQVAIELSGMLSRCPEIDLTRQAVGVFSHPKKLSDLVQEGDRIEIYRPLTMDPKEARRKRGR